MKFVQLMEQGLSPNTKSNVEYVGKISENKGVENVLKDIQNQIKKFDKPKTDKLFNIKVINAMKDKRNKIKNKSMKAEYQVVIDRLEKEYKK